MVADMRKLITILLLLAALMSVAFASPQQDFFDRMAPVAQEIIPQYGLWPSVFLAQAALESGWGRSYLSTNVNNYFGRKCLVDPCVEVWTPEVIDGKKVVVPRWFQAYPDIKAALHGYCLQFYRRWQDGTRVYLFDASTPQSFVESVAARYAGDRKYAEKVLEIIRRYDLTRFDTLD
jgi:flagellum-specific peptidoglycan hydrolase FlgJ